MHDGRTTIKILTILLFIVCMSGYSLYQARKVIEGPMIRIASPYDGTSTSTSMIDIQGTSSNIAFMYLNGRKIFTNDAGEFNENILLFPGHNVIELRAEDKFGKTTEHTLTIYRTI